MTSEEMAEIKLSGVWRSGKGETFPTLIYIGAFKIGFDVWANRDVEIMVHVHAKIVKRTEGAAFPRRLEMLMPKNGFVILIDSLFAMGMIASMEVEATGCLFGPGGLPDEPDETVILQKTIKTRTPVDDIVAAAQYVAPMASNKNQWPKISSSNSKKWRINATSQISLGDQSVKVIESPYVPSDEIVALNEETSRVMNTTWAEMVKEFKFKSHYGGA